MVKYLHKIEWIEDYRTVGDGSDRGALLDQANGRHP